MSENRRYNRIPIKLEAKYIFSSSNKENRCTVIDISRGGVKLEIDGQKRIRKGANICLKIDSPSKSKSVSSLVDIAWTRRVQNRGNPKIIAGGQIQEMKIIEHNPACRLLDYAFDYWQTQTRTTSSKVNNLLVKPVTM